MNDDDYSEWIYSLAIGTISSIPVNDLGPKAYDKLDDNVVRDERRGSKAIVDYKVQQLRPRDVS